jgi:hypothetical protein
MGWTIGVRFPVGPGNVSDHHCFQSGFGAQPIFYPMDTAGSLPGVKRLERETEHSPLSSPEGKNAWSYKSIPL